MSNKRRGQNKRGGEDWGSEIFVKIKKRGGGQNKREVGLSKNPLISVMNEKRDINVHKLLMLNLKVSKNIRSAASKNKAMIKKLSKYK